MARIESLSILKTDEGKDLLAEAYAGVIENIEKTTISARLKNNDLSGDPNTGTVEAKRFVNSDSQPYGTARSGGKGEAIKAKPVIIAIDTDRELINEVEEKDVALYGVSGLIARKSAMNEGSMRRELEREFFKVAVADGVKVTPKKTKISEKVEELIQLIENTKNDFVDGVPRDMIEVVLDSATFGELRDYLDTVSTTQVGNSEYEVGKFHSVSVTPTVYLPTGTSMVAMVRGAVAQPVKAWEDDADKFPASNAWHFGIFYSYGTKSVMPELIATVSTGA